MPLSQEKEKKEREREKWGIFENEMKWNGMLGIGGGCGTANQGRLVRLGELNNVVVEEEEEEEEEEEDLAWQE